MFLATSRVHEFLLHHRGTTWHFTYTIESGKSNLDYIDNPYSNSTAHMPVSSLDPSDPQQGNYIPTKRDAQAEYLAQIKPTLCQAILNINIADPIQTKRAHNDLMHEVNREAIYIGIKYSVKMEPMYFEWDKFIPTLEKHFPDILWDIGP